MLRWILVLAMLFFASSSLAADVGAPEVVDTDSGCVTWTLCDEQAANGTCKGPDGTSNSIARSSTDHKNFTADAYATTDAGAWTVLLYQTGAGGGYQATKRMPITPVALSITNWTAKWEYQTGDIYAVIAGYTAGEITVKITGCP